MPIIMTGKRFQEQSGSTPWNNIDTASYSGNNFSVGGVESSPSSIWFKPDGMKLYLSGLSSGEIHEFDLATSWDITSLNYTNKSFSTATQDNRPYDIQFKPDGSKFYIVGESSDRLYEYDVSTPWDISTASYSGNLFDPTSVTSGNLLTMFFRDTGDTMWVSGANRDFISEFGLTTSWNISTASYNNTEYEIGADSGEQNPRSIFFKSGGDRYFMTGDGTDAVHEWDMTTDWDVSTSVYNTSSFDISSEDGFPFDVYFKSDGSKFWILGFDNDTIYEYNL